MTKGSTGGPNTTVCPAGRTIYWEPLEEIWLHHDDDDECVCPPDDNDKPGL